MAELSEEMLGVKLRAGDTVADGRRAPAAHREAARARESRSSSSKRCPTSPTPTSAGWTRRSRPSPTRSSCPYLHRELFAEYSAAGAQGHPALRAARVRQDPDRQGRGQLAGQEGGRGDRATPTSAATSSTSRAPSCSTSTWARPSARSAWSSSGPGRRPTRACRSSSSSTRWTRSSAPGAPASARTWSRPSCRSCWPRSTGWSRCRDVIVIGASNREDLIDPAILRPGRLDVKIKIERPNEEAAAQIFSRYLTADLPLDADEVGTPRRGRPGQGRPGHDRGRPWPRCTARTTRTASSRSPTRTATRRSSTTATSPRGP